MLYCFVSSHNWLISVKCQFIHLENEEKASLSLLSWVSRAGIKGKNGAGFGILVDSSSCFKRPQRLPRPKAPRLYPEPRVPCFPLLCLLPVVPYDIQLRCHLLQEVFLTLSRLESLPPSPGSLSPGLLSLPLESSSYYIAGLSSPTCISACAGHIGGMPMPAPLRKQGGRRSQGAHSGLPAEGPQGVNLSLSQGAWAVRMGVLCLSGPSYWA